VDPEFFLKGVPNDFKSNFKRFSRKRGIPTNEHENLPLIFENNLYIGQWLL
jgi:hypothetical protein